VRALLGEVDPIEKAAGRGIGQDKFEVGYRLVGIAHSFEGKDAINGCSQNPVEEISTLLQATLGFNANQRGSKGIGGIGKDQAFFRSPVPFARTLIETDESPTGLVDRNRRQQHGCHSLNFEYFSSRFGKILGVSGDVATGIQFYCPLSHTALLEVYVMGDRIVQF
jgi:hypothetical protein